MNTTTHKTPRKPGIDPTAKPESKPFDMWDNDSKLSVHGLVLRVQPSGVKTYYVQIKRGVRVKLHSASNMTLTGARKAAKDKCAEAQTGTDFSNQRKRRKAEKSGTLQAYLDGPFKEYAEANIASHAEMVARIKGSFAKFLAKPMTEITPIDMARWRKGRTDVALATAKRDFNDLLAAMNRAVKDGIITSHQLGGFKVTGTLQDGEGVAKVRYLTPAEETRLRAALDTREMRIRTERASGNAWRRERGHDLLPDIRLGDYADHIKPLILLALNTGLRRGDLFSLKWDHVDLGRKQIRKAINKSSHAKRKAGKTPTPAVLPLSTEAHAILTQLKRQRDPDSELVFPSPVSGTRLDNIKKGFAAVMTDAKIKGFRFHDLRHTFASKLVMAGVDLNTVRELMTHGDIKMTLIYAHLTDAHKSDALAKAFG